MLGFGSARAETAWSTRAAELADWALNRMVNRVDRWAAFLPPKKQTPTEPAKAVKGKLKEPALVAHFVAEDVSDLIGLPAVSKDGTCKWFAIEVKRQGEDDPARPGDIFQAAIGWYDRLRELRFSPMLFETGENTFLVMVLFDLPVAATQAVEFVENFTSDYGDRELYLPPRLFPDRSFLTGDEGENWVRLPGRHFATDHYTRVWDGDQWLGEEPAVAMVLNAPTNSENFLSQKAVQDNESPDEAKRPPITDDGIHWPKEESEYELDLPAAAHSARPKPAPAPTPQPQADADDAALEPELIDEPASPTEPTPMTNHPFELDQPAAAQPPKQAPPMTFMQQPTPHPTAPHANHAHSAPSPAAPAGGKTPAIPGEVQQAVDQLAAQTGMREEEIVRRVFQWVSQQDEVVRAVILGQIPEALRPNVWKMIADNAAA